MSEDHTRSIFKTMDDMVEQINKTKKVTSKTINEMLFFEIIRKIGIPSLDKYFLKGKS